MLYSAPMPCSTPRSADPDADVAAAIQAIHAAPPRLVFAFAGAGSLALHWLHAVPGSSQTVLEGRDCYAPRSLEEIIGGPLVKSVSLATAEAMARWAAARAAALAEGEWPLLGVACTAAITTSRERRGANHAIVAVWAGRTVRSRHLTILKGARDRLAEEGLVSRLVIASIAAACGVGGVGLDLRDGEGLEEVRSEG
jgi:nicotinamide mononucleotide (NMN) deamidase PncC